MTTQNWPAPKRPGVPMFPERDGWHVIDARSGGITVLTYWNGKEWSAGDCVRGLNSSPEWWRYNGAVLSATQINEILAAERERCARLCNDIGAQASLRISELSNRTLGALLAQPEKGRMDADYECAANIRNLGAAP
ncbi:hypothetical protein NBRC3280_1876 [Acetobacter pasteurianus NBRC 3280]|uniref:Uncharacterized protein n=1 Tax=Acetobacter pasteurianus NBRC 3278 TaxID=1226660 RepID=A0A401X5B0_ACEPA|nr:hypothetical protein [Acetobacter pasteurianus]GCD59363.1 hypothetical protein NBRC3277_1938 [Acetobacter pasteurianus NBRC 3277]GCD62868.1 hypothetical protein NBRC3278_1961 [Acetobacter pasteurianus NBRC 3278]GCD69241.1 hypothetical protein NBRC3280_1876 [Acetobacter pasteurianus NBRC 3280]